MLGTKPFITNIIDSKVGASEKNSEDKITEVKFQILKESLKNHDSLMTDIPKDLMEKYEREYEKFECDMFDFQVEFYTQLEVDDKIDIQPFFEEFRHELEG